MKGRIFITGDKHGSFISFFGLAERNKLSENDILIIAGDAGYVWDDSYPYKAETLQQIFPGTITFIDGNHENFDIINGLPVEEWKGGKVHRVSERMYHLMRGEVYNLFDENFFVFGGARSVDKDRRVEGESWWDGEEPTDEEMENAKARLMKDKDSIHYVITHETSLFARSMIAREKPIDDDYKIPEKMNEWYDIIKDGKCFKKWYFGHMHVDQVITPKMRGLHTDIRLIGSDEIVKWG